MRASRASVSFVAALAGLLALGTSSACAPAAKLHAGETEARACPHDAVATRGDACACLPGLTPLEGACVGASEVAAYCGGAAHPGGSATCETAACPPGEAIDLARQACVPWLTVRSLAVQERSVPEGTMLGCHEGSALVVRGYHVGCLPLAETCPRGMVWEGRRGRCVAVPGCGRGMVRSGGCVPVVSRAAGAGGEAIVEVGRWARGVLGADGGEGTGELCGPLRQRPWDFEVSPGGARTVVLAVELRFPDNDVTQLRVQSRVIDGTTGGALGGEAARAAGGALGSLLEPLRALGGTAAAASLSLRLRCAVQGGSSPLVLPR